MQRVEVNVQPDQVWDVVELQRAIQEYTSALERLRVAKEKFGIPLEATVGIDAENKRILYAAQENGE